MSRLTVLYDADCGFCRWSLARLLAFDRGRLALLPEPIQSETGQRLLAGLPPAERLSQAHVVDAGGRVASGGDAVTAIAAVLPGAPVTLPFARALAAPTRVAYRQVAGRRSALGRLVSQSARERADVAIARHRWNVTQRAADDAQ